MIQVKNALTNIITKRAGIVSGPYSYIRKLSKKDYKYFLSWTAKKSYRIDSQKISEAYFIIKNSDDIKDQNIINMAGVIKEYISLQEEINCQKKSKVKV